MKAAAAIPRNRCIIENLPDVECCEIVASRKGRWFAILGVADQFVQLSQMTPARGSCAEAGTLGFCYNFMFRPAGEFDMANPLAAGPPGEAKMDAASLYREEIYTDRVAAT